MFNKNSALVKIWLRLLTQDDSGYTIDNVPSIDNLREVVVSLL